jgi:hypothetical protein
VASEQARRTPPGDPARRDVSIPIGIAYEAVRIGGYDWEADRDLGPREAVWRLVVEGGPVEGRFVLRGGRFVEMAEEAG